MANKKYKEIEICTSICSRSRRRCRIGGCSRVVVVKEDGEVEVEDDEIVIVVVIVVVIVCVAVMLFYQICNLLLIFLNWSFIQNDDITGLLDIKNQ